MALDYARVRANLEARILYISEELAAMNPSKAGGVPDYKGAGGVNHVDYKRELRRELKELREELAALPLDSTGSGGTSERFVII